MKVFAFLQVLLSVTTTEALQVFHRGLAVTQQCIEDTNALYSENADLENAYEALEGEIYRGAGCFDGQGFCNIDYASLDSAVAFRDACDAAGGQNIMVNATTDCPTTPIMFLYLNVMDCVSTSCSASGAEGRADETFMKTSNRLETMVDGACEYGKSDFVTYHTPQLGGEDDDSNGIAIAGLVFGLLAFLGGAGYIFYIEKRRHEEKKKARHLKFSREETSPLGNGDSSRMGNGEKSSMDA